MRIPFLILTPVSIFLGFSTSVLESVEVQSFDLSLVLICALFAHISVNMLNEYYDCRSGLDAKTTKTPFSGGSVACLERRTGNAPPHHALNIKDAVAGPLTLVPLNPRQIKLLIPRERSCSNVFDRTRPHKGNRQVAADHG